MYQQQGRSVTGGLAAAIIIIGLILSFAFGGFHLSIFFVALAFATLVGSLGTLNPKRIYSGFIGFFWLLIVALFFATGSWVWFLVGVILSIVLGALVRPILGMLVGLGAATILSNQASQSQQYYQPQQQYYQPQQPPYYQPQNQPYQPPQPYQQGYQPPVQTYQEGNQSYPYPGSPSSAQQPYMQNDAPQAYYPQQMPPQQ